MTPSQKHETLKTLIKKEIETNLCGTRPIISHHWGLEIKCGNVNFDIMFGLIEEDVVVKVNEIETIYPQIEMYLGYKFLDFNNQEDIEKKVKFFGKMFMFYLTGPINDSRLYTEYFFCKPNYNEMDCPLNILFDIRRDVINSYEEYYENDGQITINLEYEDNDTLPPYSK